MAHCFIKIDYFRSIFSLLPACFYEYCLCSGDVKLFDFGLAKFLPPDARSVDETYTLSGAGSLRYMAPEVAKGDNYNLKVPFMFIEI